MPASVSTGFLFLFLSMLHSAVLAVDAQIRMSSLFAIAVLLVHAFTFPFSFSSFRATFSATRRLNLRVPPGGAFSDLDT